MISVQVNSEIQPLQKVLVHRPDEGISRVSPRRSNELLFDDVEKTIITLPSSELSRARGGTHCMTCPLIRVAL